VAACPVPWLIETRHWTEIEFWDYGLPAAIEIPPVMPSTGSALVSLAGFAWSLLKLWVTRRPARA
jgi:hypothetical protein